MKTTVIKLEGIESVLSPAGVEKQLCTQPGIHKVETNFMTGTATVYHDEAVTLADIKRYVAECGYGCSGECLPEHVCQPGDPPAAAVTMSHAGHATPAVARAAGASVPECFYQASSLTVALDSRESGNDIGVHQNGNRSRCGVILW